MKAPDKLVFNEALFSDIGIFGIEDETEYIRKDALLEWAKENHKRMVEVHSDYTKIHDEYFRGLIDKIESL